MAWLLSVRNALKTVRLVLQEFVQFAIKDSDCWMTNVKLHVNLHAMIVLQILKLVLLVWQVTVWVDKFAIQKHHVIQEKIALCVLLDTVWLVVNVLNVTIKLTAKHAWKTTFKNARNVKKDSTWPVCLNVLLVLQKDVLLV